MNDSYQNYTPTEGRCQACGGLLDRPTQSRFCDKCFPSFHLLCRAYLAYARVAFERESLLRGHAPTDTVALPEALRELLRGVLLRNADDVRLAALPVILDTPEGQGVAAGDLVKALDGVLRVLGHAVEVAATECRIPAPWPTGQCVPDSPQAFDRTMAAMAREELNGEDEYDFGPPGTAEDTVARLVASVALPEAAVYQWGVTCRESPHGLTESEGHSAPRLRRRGDTRTDSDRKGNQPNIYLDFLAEAANALLRGPHGMDYRAQNKEARVIKARIAQGLLDDFNDLNGEYSFAIRTPALEVLKRALGDLEFTRDSDDGLEYFAPPPNT